MADFVLSDNGQRLEQGPGTVAEGKDTRMACERCGGFTVHNDFYGADEYAVWQYAAMRCINCGAITASPSVTATGLPVGQGNSADHVLATS
jgi:hypothetical protein